MAIHDLTPPNGGGERYCSPRPQIGPVTRAIRAVRAAEPLSLADGAIQAIRDGLTSYFDDADRQRLLDLRASIAARIAADLALLDTIDGRRA